MTQAEKVASHPWDADFRFSQAMRVGDLVFVSGQAAIDENAQIVGEGDFMAQAHQVFKNLKLILEQAGSGLERIVKVGIFITDMSYFPQIIELRGEYFTEPYPADTIVQVEALALPGLMLEIEAIATVD